MTEFADEHPGGPDALLDVAGRDGTAECVHLPRCSAGSSRCDIHRRVSKLWCHSRGVDVPLDASAGRRLTCFATCLCQRRFDDIGHSTTAINDMKQYEIGRFEVRAVLCDAWPDRLLF